MILSSFKSDEDSREGTASAVEGSPACDSLDDPGLLVFVLQQFDYLNTKSYDQLSIFCILMPLLYQVESIRIKIEIMAQP